MLDENKSLVKSFFDKANRNGKTPVEMFTHDFIAHIGGEAPMSLEEFEGFQEGYFSAFSNTEVEIDDMVAEGDRVAFRGVVRAVHTGKFGGVDASGRKISVPIIGFARIEDARIAEWWNSPDRLSWMLQIGALPKMRKNK